jgi:hypothetical protein
MSKIKMRCSTCNKWFQSSGAKDTICPECLAKARKDKQAAKAAPPVAPKVAGAPGSTLSTPPPKPKQAVGGSTSWLDTVEDVKVSEAEPPPPPKPKLPPVPRDTRPAWQRESNGQQRDERGPVQSGYRGSGGGQRDERGQSGGYRSPGAYRDQPLSGSIVGGISQRPRQPGENRGPGGQRPVASGGPRGDQRFAPKGGKPAAPRKPKSQPTLKPKREKIPPPEPFKPAPEQVTQIETRYLELSANGEFDGIRSQISIEIGIPKKAVKQVIKELRDREHIPSWWETQTYKGDEE